jgi:hypothetical protein
MKNEQFVNAVVKLVGYDTPPPEQIRQYIERLKEQGYSPTGAAGQVRMFLAVNNV